MNSMCAAASSMVKRAFVILGITLVFMPMTVMRVSAEEQPVKFTYDISLMHNSISGPGAAQSFLPVGSHFLGEFDYRFNSVRADSKLFFHLRTRITDDRSIDQGTWSLGSFELKLSEQHRRLELGDIYADFSPYSLSGTMKGAKYDWNPAGGKQQWSVVSGLAYPRWENFWDKGRSQAIKRSAQGINFKETASEKWSYGISLLRTSDRDRLETTDALYDNRLFAFNWEHLPEDGMTLKGESAFSRSVVSPSQGEAVLNQSGKAHQLVWNHNLRHQRWSYEYEYVSPTFNTLLGSAVADREKMKLKWRRSLDADTSLQFGLLWFHDQLNGSSKIDRTDVYQPDVTLSVNAPFEREDATLDLRMGLDRRFDSANSTSDKNIGINYRDVVGKVDIDLSLEGVHFNTKAPSDSSKSHEYNANCILSTRLEQGDAVLRPNVAFGSQRNRNVIGLYSDRMTEVSVGLGYDIPKADFTASMKVGKKHSDKGAAGVDDSKRWFASLDMEGKPAYLAWLGKSAKHYLRISINDYKFDTAGNNYRETSIVTGVKVDL